MSTETVTLQVPKRLYADLIALAEEEQTDVVGAIARLMTTRNRQQSTSLSRAHPRRRERQSNQHRTTTPLIEMMRRSLHLSSEQWNQLRRDLPETIDLSRAIGECLTPNTHLSAEIVAMREA
ncbi:MAG TPA: hypothetical protein PLJ78_16065 [Anaerolineae bacterium]|nr:hypothetical protein [Anaerolineae bacterium]HQK15449.1 hypothetical protein [Anaerolineae bacterium]